MVIFWSLRSSCPSWLDRWLSASTSHQIFLRPVLLAAALAMIVPINSYAVTSSDAEYESEPDDFEDFKNRLLGTPSDAEKEGDDDEFEQDDLSVYFLRGLYMLLEGDSAFLGPSFNQEAVQATPNNAEYEVAVYSDDAFPLALGDSDGMANVISYDVTVNGTDYVLYLPPDSVDSLYIDSAGRLWNVGTGNVTGRLFQGSFNATATTGILVTLGPCLGNTFSSNRNYGSPNYMRNYYWSGSSLNYTTTYITIYVNQSRYPFRVSDTLPYVVIFLLGGILICLWRKSLR